MNANGVKFLLNEIQAYVLKIEDVVMLLFVHFASFKQYNVTTYDTHSIQLSYGAFKRVLFFGHGRDILSRMGYCLLGTPTPTRTFHQRRYFSIK